jgi:tight adherence protein B
MNGIGDVIDLSAGAFAIGIVFLVLLAAGIFYLVAQGQEQARLKRRLAGISLEGKDQRQIPIGRGGKGGSISIRRERADSSIGILDQMIKNLLPRPAVMRARLLATGKRIPISEYLLASLVVGGVSFVAFYTGFGWNGTIALALAIGVTVAVPHIVIGFMISSRQKKFIAQFPEAIDLMVRGLKSGVPISESMRVVGQQIPDPVGITFREITDGMLLGQTFNAALADASSRINLTEFRFFEISLNLQQETGGNLSETLEILGNTLRKRRQMKQKIKALSSEARAGAYIIGGLPFLMLGILFLLSPQYAGLLLYDWRGHIILGVAFCTEALGAFIMFQMGRFEI